MFKCKSLNPAVDAHVDVANMELYHSVWSIVDISLNIASSDIHSMQIILQKASSRNNISVHITGSQIGSGIKMFTAQAKLENCCFLQKNLAENEPYILAENSAISVKSSQFENIHGPSFLWLTSGMAHITDVEFVNSVPVDSLLKIMNESHVSVENCTFTEIGGPCLDVFFNSTAIIRNSMFKNNTCFDNTTNMLTSTGHHCLSVSASFLEVTNSYFVNNILLEGSVVSLEDGSFGVVEASKFFENTAIVGASVTMFNGTFMMNRCTVSRNSGQAVVHMNSSFFLVSSCLFQGNYASAGGPVQFDSTEVQVQEDLQDKKFPSAARLCSVIQNSTENLCRPILKQNQRKQVCNCTFVDNTGQLGGAIHAQNITIVLENNHFVNNSAVGDSKKGGIGGAVFYKSIKNDCIQISNSNFVHNYAFYSGGAIFVASQTNIQGCKFAGNGAVNFGGAYVFSSGSESMSAFFWKQEVTLHNCSFVANTAENGGAMWVVFEENSDVPNENIPASHRNTSVHFSLHMSTTLFIQNHASYGGGVHIQFSTTAANMTHSTFVGYHDEFVHISNCTFLGNTATWGGEMYAQDVSLVLKNNYLMNNSAVQHNTMLGLGGAIFYILFNTNASLQVSNSTFVENHATAAGGAISTGSLTNIPRSFFPANSTQEPAAAAMCLSQNKCTQSISNSTFFGNTAEMGGAICVEYVSLKLRNSHFENNSAVSPTNKVIGTGGAIVFLTSNFESFLMLNSSFVQNHASIEGGAILLENVEGSSRRSSPVDWRNNTLSCLNDAKSFLKLRKKIRNCTFVGNIAQSGGAVVAFNVSIVFKRNHFANNLAGQHNNKSGSGGAIVYSSSNSNDFMLVSHSSFSQNHATSDGGAIYAESPAIIDDCTFTENSAVLEGGAAELISFVKMKPNSAPMVPICNCTFFGNTAEYGGAIHAYDVSLFFKNNQMDNNSASFGGAIEWYSTMNTNNILHVSNSSFNQNHAPQKGGAILAQGEWSTFMRNGTADASRIESSPHNTWKCHLENCTFVDNTGGHGGAIDAFIVNLNITAIDVKPELTVFNCRFVGNTGNFGGAIKSEHVILILTNSHFMKNSALQYTNVTGMGGAVYITLLNREHSAQISNSTFNQNQASGGGGGVVVVSSSSHPILHQSTFLENKTVMANGTFITPSGNITTSHLKSRKHVKIINCTFLQNTAQWGGALAVISVPLFLQNSHFENNSAAVHTTECIGGAIYISSNNILDSNQISLSSFKQNHAAELGGAIAILGPQANVKDSLFFKNSAGQMGGALYFMLLTPWTITRCIFQFNIAEIGGALCSFDFSIMADTPLSLVIQNSTFTHNTASIDGGAIYRIGSFFCTFCNFLKNKAG